MQIKIKSIKKIEHASKRYDLQTKNSHAFYANNILVHNSICIVWFYKGEWHVSTSGTPDASGNVHFGDMTFAELFWDAAKKTELYYRCSVYEYFKENGSHESFTWMFELTSPYNRNVVKYQESKLTLIGIRDIENGKEDQVWRHKDIAVKEYSFGSTDGAKLIEEANTLKGTEHEGFVVVDDNFNRVKIKGQSYLAFDKAKNSFSLKNLLAVILSGETEELLTYKAAFPEWLAHFDEVQNKLDKAIEDTENVYNKYKHIEVQKDFALAIKDNKFNGFMFAVRKGTYKSIKDAFYKQTADKLWDMIS